MFDYKGAQAPSIQIQLFVQYAFCLGNLFFDISILSHKNWQRGL